MTSLTSSGAKRPCVDHARASTTACGERRGVADGSEVVREDAAVGTRRRVAQHRRRRVGAAWTRARRRAVRAARARAVASTILVRVDDDDERDAPRRDDLLAGVRAARALDEPTVGRDLVGAVDGEVESIEGVERLDARSRAARAACAVRGEVATKTARRRRAGRGRSRGRRRSIRCRARRACRLRPVSAARLGRECFSRSTFTHRAPRGRP